MAQGVGFAVPINTARDSVEELITTGEVVHGFIGVEMFTYGIDEIAALTGLSIDELESRYGFPSNGALVSEVTGGGPADEAGISGGGGGEEVEGIPGVPVEGDVITAVEGEKITASGDVIEVVNARDPGDDISMTVVTPNEGQRQVELTVDQRPEDT